MKRQQSWYVQAEADFRAAQGLLDLKLYSHVCFLSQQVAEKCLKSIAYARDFDLVKGHSLVHIANDLKINGELESAARVLDIYYISARYPDALPDNAAPATTFGEQQAREALALAQLFLKKAKEQM